MNARSLKNFFYLNSKTIVLWFFSTMIAIVAARVGIGIFSFISYEFDELRSFLDVAKIMIETLYVYQQ
jgi:hypothetical protein